MIHEHHLYRSRYPELCVDIREQHMKDGRVRVTGTAIRAADDTEYLDIAPYQTKPVTYKRVNGAITEAIDIIASRYYETYGEGELTKEAFQKAFEAVEAAVQNGHRLKPSWDSESTNNDVIRFFRRNTLLLICPKLISGRMFLEEDQRELQAEMTSICARHGSESDLAAQENAKKRLMQAEIVLSHMRDYDPRIPEVRLTSPDFSACPYRDEQIKMLPIPVLLRFYRELFSLVDNEPYKVFFAVLAVINLRPAEAAGTKPSDIFCYDSFCSIRVCHQEEAGKLTTRMKNDYSKRWVVATYWPMQILKRCCELIGDDYPADDSAMNCAAECAAWSKQLLIECGATETQLKEIGSDISEADMDDDSIYDPKRAQESMKNKEKKLGCYVLRRCAATIMRVYMGLSLFETDCLLGHIPHGSGKNTAGKLAHPDLNAPETQRRIAEKMERYIYDPEYTRNPKYMPITTAKKDAIRLTVGYPEAIIKNNEKASLWLELDLSAAEAGDSLSINVPDQDCSTLSSSSVPICYEGINRTVFIEMPDETKDR